MSSERSKPYTTVELASAAGVSDAYIRQLLLAGKLDGYKASHIWLIPPEVGEAWLRERRAHWEKF